ncbi:MAG: hypothetical protein WEB50_14775 [Vicinamibacterales bacterium]
MLLLLWTAADLSNASLCALDTEGEYAVSFSARATLSGGSDAPAPDQTPQRHIDDCFCCSHCVDVQAFAPATLVMPVALQRTPLDLAAPRLFGSPLYRPPLA